MIAVKDMTFEQLQALIDERVERKLQERLGRKDTRSVEEIMASIKRNRWTPPPGAPSNLELLREDRDR
jgi:ParB-like chromosome segregation protein Spo0J